MNDTFDALWYVFGLRESSINALTEAVEWVWDYISVYDFYETLEKAIDQYVKNKLEDANETLQSVLANLPQTKEGWISWFIQEKIPIYSADYGGLNGDEIIRLEVEREEWDETPANVRDLVIAYFKELVEDLNALVVIDQIRRDNRTYIYHNGKLHKVL